ncbi:MAG: hypothetical protein KTR25_01065 [Myxococcales bacterium]|nr:hypothetical protein [Myxococcales bacterium]
MGEFKERLGLVRGRALDELVSRICGRKIRTTPQTPPPSGFAQPGDDAVEWGDSEKESSELMGTSSTAHKSEESLGVVTGSSPQKNPSGPEAVLNSASVLTQDGIGQSVPFVETKPLESVTVDPGASIPPELNETPRSSRDHHSSVIAPSPTSKVVTPASTSQVITPPPTSQIRRSVYTSKPEAGGEVPVTTAQTSAHIYRVYLLPRGSDQLFVSWRIDGEPIEEMVTLALRYADGLMLVSVHHAPSLKGEAFIEAPTPNVSYVTELFVGTRRVVRSAPAEVLPKNRHPPERPRFVQLAPTFEPWSESQDLSSPPRSVRQSRSEPLSPASNATNEVSAVIRDESRAESPVENSALPTWWPVEGDVLPVQVTFSGQSGVLPPPFTMAPVAPWKQDLPGSVQASSSAWVGGEVFTDLDTKPGAAGSRATPPSSSSSSSSSSVKRWDAMSSSSLAQWGENRFPGSGEYSRSEYVRHSVPSSEELTQQFDKALFGTGVRRWWTTDEHAWITSTGMVHQVVTQRESAEPILAEDMRSMFLPPLQFDDGLGVPDSTKSTDVWLNTANRPNVQRLTRYLHEQGALGATFDDWLDSSTSGLESAREAVPPPIAPPKTPVVRRAPHKPANGRRLWASIGVLPPLRSVPVFPRPQSEPERPVLPAPRRVAARRPESEVTTREVLSMASPTVQRLIHRSERQESAVGISQPSVRRLYYRQ